VEPDLTHSQPKSEIVTNDADALIGAVIALAADSVDFLIDHVGIDSRNDAELHPAKGLFTSFAATARTVIEEYDYFDLDYRSEVAELIDSSFRLQPSNIFTSRLHFFSAEVGRDGTDRLHDFVEASTSTYLGYTILPPEKPVRFGRSMVSAKTVLGPILSAEIAAKQIRTAVAESVNLFGIPLEVVGVPFMEQDGNLLRCAHVSAWMCHYAAVLRGSVSRKPSAHFHRTGDAAQSVGRPYPSGGVTTPGLSAMLKASDLPPEVLDRHALSAPRDLYWADRSQLVALFADAIAAKDEKELERLWLKENLLAAVCRYLNSGIPVILARDSLVHTQVIVGYLREKDLRTVTSHDGTPDSDDTHSDVVSFIVSDDQQGPFILVSVDDVVKEFTHEGWAETQLVIPLPRSLWMSGEAAERIAALAFPAIAKARAKVVSQWDVLARDSARIDRHAAALETFVRGLSRPGTDEYTVRTYTTTGIQFKQSFAARIRETATSDVELVRGSGAVQLPKYVWVVEVLDRQLRRTDKPPVVATVVLDATHTVHNIERITSDDQSPLFLHMPGQSLAGVPSWLEVSAASFEDPDGLGGERDEDTKFLDDFWIETTFEPYNSGRWSQKVVGSFAYSVNSISKLAT